jgi:uncharacterized protein YbjT (DUF2867 family)
MILVTGVSGNVGGEVVRTSVNAACASGPHNYVAGRHRIMDRTTVPGLA